ncbi:MAG: BtaA family protein [Chitinophagales bacterium]
MPTKLIGKIHDATFRYIHSKNLIYNTCWEDPKCDRALLDIDSKSKIVMITSAGCNALDYLLDDPQEINSIDVNPIQNALLNLKLALFEASNYEELFQFFGEGHHKNAQKIYTEMLRPHLLDFAQTFWDRKIDYFNGKGLKKTFYFQGTSGIFAWFIHHYIKIQPSLKKNVEQLLWSNDLDEQRSNYNDVESKLLNPFVCWITNQKFVFALLGIPRAQRDLITQKYAGGISAYIMDCLRKVFYNLPIHENYFWRVYITGKYEKDCCPNYLKEENFESLKSRVSNIHLHNTTISRFLVSNPQKYSHYVLLDHQDWLAEHDVPALEEEWDLILQNSRSGSKILLRSAASTIDFFPDIVQRNVRFDKEKTAQWHSQDRVGTYNSVYLATVK